MAIDAWIGPDPASAVAIRRAALPPGTPGGVPARTDVEVLERHPTAPLARVSCRIHTGRTHQIRVHMAHIGAPLVGDPVYGGRPRLPKRPSPELKQALQQFPRQALHAKSLRFAHPIHSHELSFESSLPEDFAELLAALRRDLAEHAT